MEKDIGKINKNEIADIVLRVDDFGQRKGLTIREFITSDRYTGFTKSGVKILAADFPKFKEMINSITEDAPPLIAALVKSAVVAPFECRTIDFIRQG